MRAADFESMGARIREYRRGSFGGCAPAVRAIARTSRVPGAAPRRREKHAFSAVGDPGPQNRRPALDRPPGGYADVSLGLQDFFSELRS